MNAIDLINEIERHLSGLDRIADVPVADVRFDFGESSEDTTVIVRLTDGAEFEVIVIKRRAGR
jgi:hypothetical protein